LRILFLSNAASIHTVRWVNSLSERGHEIHLVYKNDDKPTENKISSKVILHPLKNSGTKAYFISAFELRGLFKRIKPDVVNAHYASGYGTLARLANVSPLVLSVWGSDVYRFPHQSKFKMKLIKKNLLFADMIASTSNCMAEVTRSLIDSTNLDISVTPFGVDVNKFTRKIPKVDNKEIVIGNIKTLSYNYAIDDLIRAIKILKDDLQKDDLGSISDKIRVLIYGEGNQKEELINLTNELCLDNTVCFMGKIPNDEVPKALEQMDIFCATSLEESFGVALVEAMAMEVPVVATDADGFKEVIQDGLTGFIVEKRKPQKIAEILKKLVLNKELRLQLGKNGRKRVLELYNWDINVDTMEQIYINISNQDK